MTHILSYFYGFYFLYLHIPNQHHYQTLCNLSSLIYVVNKFSYFRLFPEGESLMKQPVKIIVNTSTDNVQTRHLWKYVREGRGVICLTHFIDLLLFTCMHYNIFYKSMPRWGNRKMFMRNYVFVWCLLFWSSPHLSLTCKMLLWWRYPLKFRYETVSDCLQEYSKEEHLYTFI